MRSRLGSACPLAPLLLLLKPKRLPRPRLPCPRLRQPQSQSRHIGSQCQPRPRPRPDDDNGALIPSTWTSMCTRRRRHCSGSCGQRLLPLLRWRGRVAAIVDNAAMPVPCPPAAPATDAAARCRRPHHPLHACHPSSLPHSPAPLLPVPSLLRFLLLSSSSSSPPCCPLLSLHSE